MLGFYPTAAAPLATAPLAPPPVPVPVSPSVGWDRVVPQFGTVWTPVDVSATVE